MRKNLTLFFRFTGFVLPYWDKILLSFIVENLVTIGILLPPLILRVLFDYAYPYKDLNLLFIFSLLPFLLAVSFNFLVIFRSFLDLFVDQSLFKKLYSTLYAKLQRIPIGFYNEHKVGDIIFRMTDDLQVVQHSILTMVPSFLSVLFKLTFLLVICFSMNKTLTFLALVGIPIYFYQTHFFSGILRHINVENREMGSRLYELLQERLSNIKLIKLFHRGKQEIERFIIQLLKLFKVERKAKITTSFQTVFSILINRFWTLIVGFYTGYCVISGQLTVGEVVAITSYIAMLQSPFENLASLYTEFVTSQVSFQRIIEILDHPEEYHEQDAEGTNLSIQGNLKFDAVGFGYTPETQFLKDLSFQVDQGKSLAIVGKSGIGKSSIIDLILRFYPHSSGRILIDDMPIEQIRLSSLREQIGLISQDAYLLDDSIKENILFGAHEKITEDHMIEAAKQADAYDFIMNLPEGFNTRVGPRGSFLSSGQRQRIAIARALIKDPKIIIFDEATSALDSESEKQIQRTLERFKGKKTVIIIAHRLTAIKLVDQVVVISNDGTISEKGSVPELMAKKGLFFKLYELQFGGFQQFLQQVTFLLKSMRRYERPLSVGVVAIQDITKIEANLDPNVYDHFIDDLAITMSLFLREVDYCAYQTDGLFWVAFPETNLEGATMALTRLQSYLKTQVFRHIEGRPIEVKWQVHQCVPEDTIESLQETLQENLHV